MSKRTRYTAEHTFINALRECLGLTPLDGEPTRTEAQRFDRSYQDPSSARAYDRPGGRVYSHVESF